MRWLVGRSLEVGGWVDCKETVIVGWNHGMVVKVAVECPKQEPYYHLNKIFSTI